MKIVILANDSDGLFLFRKELISELAKQHKVIAYVPDTGHINDLEATGCKVKNVVIDRRGVNPIKDLSFLKSIITILKREKPELVITYTIKPNVYGGFVCRLMKIPYASNITGLGTALQNPGLLRTLVTFMYRVSLKRAKVVFFENSENLKTLVDGKMVKKKQACLLNGAGVNLERFYYAQYPNIDEIRFLFIGRVMKEKGINELLDAMKHLVADGIKCSLDIVGSFEEDYKECLVRYQAEGWLRYHGHQMDVRPFIVQSHCFVLPSWHEGMANTNLECAAMGRPLITSDIPGCREAVVDGVSGFLCKRKNTDSLYTAMKKFVDLSFDERKNMGVAGRNHMEDVFDKQKVVKKTIERLM